MELLLEPLSLTAVQSKTIIDKFAAVGILQVLFCSVCAHAPWIRLKGLSRRCVSKRNIEKTSHNLFRHPNSNH